ncbi:forespore regulator of the sigma-K checkpoint [Bacillus sp. OV322]|uniref:intercompartmental signaling factor BofC n=1 Tax=Bacillus sp. OV322 TaxID=1882764 RepID=UPI0008E4420A|nr:intercompartmental signaling factor BofC [Bacillus sp. OV322]SFC53706.1 forespore regulator of the sigma-K checkpoint [Bacillus sp. OV322]
MKSRLLLLFVMIIGISASGALAAGAEKPSHSEKETTPVIKEPLERKVILKRHYLDGEVSEETVTETILSMEDFWAKYEDWQLVDQNSDEMVFKKQENDISPLMKVNGFFGISEDGTLSIFNGRPDNHPIIIHSFFQIDLGRLDSYKQKELLKGIPIMNKDHYEEVIEAYKPYSVLKTKN